MCCDGKPVRLNHLNDGVDHLADDIPIRNDDAAPMNVPDLKLTKVTGRSTRWVKDVTTEVTDKP